MSSPTPATPRRGRPLLWLLLYACGVGLALAAGYRMMVPYWYFQILARQPLSTRLGESLWNLHAQPPELNLLLGLALKLEQATGWAPERSLLALHLVLGAVAVLALHALLVRLGVSPWPRRLALLVVLFDPAFYGFVLLFFYTMHELLLLILAAAAIQRFLATRRARWYAGACACLVALTWTHTLFHFGWALALLAALALAVRPDGLRRPIPVLLAASAILLLAWPVKNALRFGVFASSSWQGFNLAQGVIPSYPPLWAAFVLDEPPGQQQAREVLALTVPERFRSIPVLADATKEQGAPNWNHYGIILVSRDLEKEVLRRLRQHPGLLLAKAAGNYRQAVVHPLRSPYGNHLEAPNRLALIWLRTYEEAAYLTFGDNPATGTPPGFAYVFPAALALTMVQVVRRRRADPVAAGTVAFLLACILWVMAMVLLVDGREANRIRFSTNPLLAVAVAWSLTRSPRSTLEPRSGPDNDPDNDRDGSPGPAEP